jgi:hypothetical protein
VVLAFVPTLLVTTVSLRYRCGLRGERVFRPTFRQPTRGRSAQRATLATTALTTATAAASTASASTSATTFAATFPALTIRPVAVWIGTLNAVANIVWREGRLGPCLVTAVETGSALTAPVLVESAGLIGACGLLLDTALASRVTALTRVAAAGARSIPPPLVAIEPRTFCPLALIATAILVVASPLVLSALTAATARTVST